MVQKNEENTRNLNAQFGNMSAQSSNITEILSRMFLPPSNNTNTNQTSSSSNLRSQPLSNPKGSLNAITLWSGTILEEMPPRAMEDLHEEEVVVEVPHEDEGDTKQEEGEVSLKEPKRKAIKDESIPIPFPSIVKKAKKTPEFDPNMLQVFKKVEGTIPLLDAIQKFSKYAKFLKDLYTHKDRIGELETLSLGSSISSLMKPISEKYSDPKPCLVEVSPIEKVGRQICLSRQECNHRSRDSRRCACDHQGFVFSVDFYILEMPLTDTGSSSSVFLGRPFLKTSKFKLDAFTGAYSFEEGDKTIKFNLEEAMRHPPEEHSVLRCDVIDEVVAEIQREDHNRLYYPVIEGKDKHEDKQEKVDEDELHDIGKKEPQLEAKTELKPLPSHLKYAFLEGNQGFSVIISSELSSQEEEKLLEVLRKHKRKQLVGACPTLWGLTPVCVCITSSFERELGQLDNPKKGSTPPFLMW
ncbi:uncharacterized protein LOC107615360 [Arachis ipaensis]|uniref:uncharacterized protein LOC107615360 n=1 Tax=Arachis ipaensis TaxID=130454 RepID=UPI0007AF35BC|nr:uncharacterized protein LOC107615360 [Arachis ipaensis]